MQKDTLQQLLAEAEERYTEAEAEFEDTDGSEAQREMDQWLDVIRWLNRKMREV